MSEPWKTGPELLTLHFLRLKGVAKIESLLAVTDLGQEEVECYLDSFRARGLADVRAGRISGWTLTAAGRSQHGQLIHQDLLDSGMQSAVDESYHTFLPLNREIIKLCTDWQIRDAEKGVFNDHQDPEYDASILARLADIHAGITPILRSLSASLSRFGTYEPRLVEADQKLRGGALEWLTRPDIQSYHTVWMELHEDLLRSLAIDRKSEVPFA